MNLTNSWLPCLAWPPQIRFYFEGDNLYLRLLEDNLHLKFVGVNLHKMHWWNLFFKDKDLVRREDVLYSSPRTSVRSEEGSKFQPAIGGSVDLFLQTGDGSSSDVNLNAMLEDLNKNMTMQGASVVPRGHCAGCAKLIVGQVGAYFTVQPLPLH